MRSLDSQAWAPVTPSSTPMFKSIVSFKRSQEGHPFSPRQGRGEEGGSVVLRGLSNEKITSEAGPAVGK